MLAIVREQKQAWNRLDPGKEQRLDWTEHGHSARTARVAEAAIVIKVSPDTQPLCV